EADPAYVPFLRERLVEAIVRADAARVPAQIGHGRIDAAEFTALRQWIRRPDRVVDDPFGNPTVRANIHAAADQDDVTSEAGPEDPELAVISVRHRDGRPLAALATFSMHYYGDQEISADYFGSFCAALERRLAPQGGCLAALAHGCSGDIWRVDYAVPKAERPESSIEDYASRLADLAARAVAGIAHRSDVDVAMAQRRLTLDYRVPDRQRLEWAERIVAAMGDRPPRDTTEVYAREQLLLHRAQRTEVVVQALRVGTIAIATSPCETYAITGLRLKAASPLERTMVIELANGGDGYIPPPEQYAFGGYNTWPARSAGLQVDAEPRIAQAAIRLLEKVSGQTRRSWQQPEGSAGRLLQSMRPAAWWRLDEFNGPVAADSSGKHRHAVFEPGITFSLEGPASAAWCGSGILNRCPQFVGGRVASDGSDLGSQYSVSLWFWNGMPAEARPVAGWVYSRDYDSGVSAAGEHLGLGGAGDTAGKIIFQTGNSPAVVGTDSIPRWTWAHVVLVRDGEQISVWLNGRQQLRTQARTTTAGQIFIGGRSDSDSNWEGRLDEVALFDRALTAQEIAALANPQETANR
ncbi:MAG: LamG-like jellyroll fold domain-containing protein, partial [Planctomycetaceae bacterium]